MKIVHVETLIARGRFAESKTWKNIQKELIESIKAIDWPPGSGKFTIYPQSGKKRNEGNGVIPIKAGLMKRLKERDYRLECHIDVENTNRPGKCDAILETDFGPFALEWETGNISSSHRALNKMCLGLLTKVLAGGVLVVPSRKLYRFLTDRIGNFAELSPYLELWRATPCEEGVLEIIVVEQDAESTKVPRIPKITAGRALG